MTGWTLVAVIIVALMIGAVFGIALLAVFIGAARSNEPAADPSEFDNSMTEWGYIGERRAGGQL